MISFDPLTALLCGAIIYLILRRPKVTELESILSLKAFTRDRVDELVNFNADELPGILDKLKGDPDAAARLAALGELTDIIKEIAPNVAEIKAKIVAAGQPAMPGASLDDDVGGNGDGPPP